MDINGIIRLLKISSSLPIGLLIGSTVLDSVVFGMYGDADIGGASSFSDDDAWFDTENDMVYRWDHDNWSSSYGGFRPAYFDGVLESPETLMTALTMMEMVIMRASLMGLITMETGTLSGMTLEQTD